jgi:PilZ domain
MPEGGKSILEALVAWPFKRKYERVNLVVQAEIRSSGKNYPFRGRTVTVGEGGCYIEVLETLEPSTTVEVVLWLNGEKVLAKAEVASNDRHIGNGIKFVDMKREDAAKLKSFLKAASQPAAPAVRVENAAPVFEVTRFTPASA